MQPTHAQSAAANCAASKRVPHGTQLILVAVVVVGGTTIPVTTTHALVHPHRQTSALVVTVKTRGTNKNISVVGPQDLSPRPGAYGDSAYVGHVKRVLI